MGSQDQTTQLITVRGEDVRGKGGRETSGSPCAVVPYVRYWGTPLLSAHRLGCPTTSSAARGGGHVRRQEAGADHHHQPLPAQASVPAVCTGEYSVNIRVREKPDCSYWERYL